MLADMARDFIEKFIQIISQLMIFAIFARVVMSWIRMPQGSPVVRIINEVTEPILGFFRRYIPPVGGVLDLSPILAYFAIEIVSGMLLRLI